MAIVTVSAMASSDISKRIEQLAVAQAVYKLAAAQVSTKEPGNLRDEVDGHFREAFESTGAKSFDVPIAGQRVGTYSVKLTKPKEDTVMTIVDRDAFEDWCRENGCVREVFDEERAFGTFLSTGELPGGCHVTKVTSPGGEFSGGTLRIDPEKVNDALGGADVLPMLMGGNEL